MVAVRGTFGTWLRKGGMRASATVTVARGLVCSGGGDRINTASRVFLKIWRNRVVFQMLSYQRNHTVSFHNPKSEADWCEQLRIPKGKLVSLAQAGHAITSDIINAEEGDISMV
ncbi:unnamed protein product [Fraxinus pennsylvanica]|uniref:Uncharacterized protein n=1 Tax=Fraxinus pennsylvanica TaxID=56036 RepID=A0AAD2A4D1_9LAMI|nr:unnamed protein product [Fraxinus pennsylvanica]